MTSPIPTLETERLVLRALTLADVPAYERHFVDYEVIRNLSHLVPWPYPEDGVRSFLEDVVLPAQGEDRWTWAIEEKAWSNECIGVVDLWREGRPENRGFWLSKAAWGRGFMTEAVSAVNDYAFDYLGFDRLVYSNARGNVGSRRVKEKSGAKLLRIEPARFVDPAFIEREVWETTRTDWLARRGR